VNNLYTETNDLQKKSIRQIEILINYELKQTYKLDKAIGNFTFIVFILHLNDITVN